MEDNHTVLITGGTGSIGKTLVASFAENGYNVSFQYLSNDVEASRLENTYGVKGLKVDLCIESQFEFGNVDVLVNNAGVNLTSSFTHDITDSDWDTTLLLNITAPFKLCRSLLPRMIEQRWGRIINISSIYGFKCVEQNLPYNVSKHAMRGFTGSIAREYAASGITVNEICPGPVESDLMLRVARREKDAEQSIEEYLNEVRREIPAQRMAVPGDVAAVALFLASEKASYINGTSIVVDGGFST
jgi:NAD(P)-dependent dehydrogenase (short-subunit alcohol dehydrogenase family)